MTPPTTALELNRRLQNHAFESWKIGSSFVASRTAVSLPGSVFLGAGEAVDFAHTKAALLSNQLFCSQGRLFVVTATNSSSIAISEVVATSGSPQAAPVVLHLADIPVPEQPAAVVAPTDAALHCSLELLVAPPPSPSTAAAAGGPNINSSSSPSFQAVFSSGKGDLVLLTHAPGSQQAACVSAPVYPLRSRAPATGAKPFTIAAAWRSAPATGGGLIRAVLSCLTDTAAAGATGGAGCQHQHRHGHSSWVCEVWLVTLSSQELVATAGANQQQPQLQVLGCQLLHVSRAPPAAAVACAGADKVLLLSEPGLEEGELPPGYKQQLAAALGNAEEQQQEQQEQPPALEPMDADQPSAAAAGAAAAGNGGSSSRAGLGMASAAAGGDTANTTAAAAAAAGGGGGGGGQDASMCVDDEDGDGDDMSPRTLAAAAARLAKYASETPAGDLPQQQWSDVFKESGPGELGAGGSEPAVDLLLFGPADAPTSSSSNTTNSGGGGGGGDRAGAAAAAAGKFVLKCTVSCGPHKLLVADSLTAGSSSGGGGSNSEAVTAADIGLLLGLTDDVDCAVVSAAFSNQLAAAAAAAADGSSGGSSDLVLTHTAFLPAIAYVVAGKTQRRHLLLAPSPSASPVCCALVEASKYSYLYGHVAPGSTHGQQQIVDMELPPGQSILGARLLQLGGGSSGSISSGSSQGGNGSSGGSSSGGATRPAATVLLLLTQSQLVCYHLKAPA